MSKNSVLDWDATASNNTDVGGIPTVGTAAVNNFDNALREIMAQIKSGIDFEQVYVTKGADYTAVLNDNNAVIRCSAALTLSLTAAATLGANWHVTVIASGGDVTVDPNGSELVDGASTLTIKQGTSALLICTGTAFITNNQTSGTLKLGTSTASTSGVVIDFTGIPAGVRRVVMNLASVSTNGTSNILFRLGTSSGFVTTGYNGAGGIIASGQTGIATAYTLGFGLPVANAANLISGSIVLSLVNASTNRWTASGNFGAGATAITVSVGGDVSLGGALDRIRIMTANGTDAFDAGEINISWEF